MLTSITLPALLPAIASAASVVFLFCSTSFGIVLTLGGLRYARIDRILSARSARNFFILSKMAPSTRNFFHTI